MIGRLYTSSVETATVTTAKTLIEIAAAATGVVLIERMWIKQITLAASEAAAVKVEDITTTGTGSANTPAEHMEGGAAAVSTVKTNMSAEPTYSGTVYVEDGWNVLTGWVWAPVSDDDYIVIAPSQLVGMMHDSTITSATLRYGMTFREIG